MTSGAQTLYRVDDLVRRFGAPTTGEERDGIVAPK
jgi:hypothetical protein